MDGVPTSYVVEVTYYPNSSCTILLWYKKEKGKRKAARSKVSTKQVNKKKTLRNS